MRLKKGISLIVLVITIIIIIILAGAVILSLSTNNPIKQATEANFKNNISEYNNEFVLWLTKQYAENMGMLDLTEINATKDTGSYNDLKIQDIITSMLDTDAEKLEIQSGKLVYVGSDETELDWISEIGIEVGSDTSAPEIVVDIPSLTWQKKYYSNFGYTQHASQTAINVYDNGNAQIAVYDAQTPYMSYYNKETKQWTIVDVPWWSHGKPDILWAGDGVFLARIVGMANIISSYDGITWHNSGYCVGAQNHMETGAYDVTRNVGVVSWWWYKSPVYYSYDSLEERTEWTLTGSDGTSVPIFKYMTAHKGNFIGVVGGDKSIALASSASPWDWTTTIPEDPDDHRYMYLRSINNKLFVLRFKYHGSPGNFSVNLCVLNDSGTELTETNLSHYGDLADNNSPNPQNILWMEDWGRYALFTQNMLYTSVDGINWEGVEQSNFAVTPHGNMFGGAIYVPGDGFYVKGNGFVYYAPYQID